MAQLGNPLGFALGGGKSIQEAFYEALKSAVGEGNYAPGHRDDSIMESWRWAKARALAAVIEDERVTAQAWPFLATDLIPMYEQLLGMAFPLSTSDQEKRDELTAQWTREIDSTIPGLLVMLQELDASITIIVPDRDVLRETQFGRAFEDWDPTDPLASGPAFNLAGGAVGPNASAYPNYSDDFIFLISYPLPVAAIIAESQKKVLVQIRDLMNEAMPAWCDQRTFTTGSGQGQPCGFVLDQDQLDLTVFCS